MSLAQTIQTAWNNQEKWLIVLRPVSWLYRFAFLMNKAMYTHNLKKIYTAPIPVMVIGNITVGGSGKTPLLIHLGCACSLCLMISIRGYVGNVNFYY